MSLLLINMLLLLVFMNMFNVHVIVAGVNEHVHVTVSVVEHVHVAVVYEHVTG